MEQEKTGQIVILNINLRKIFAQYYIFFTLFVHFTLFFVNQGLRGDHFLVYFFVLFAYFWKERSRDFIKDYFPIVIFWLVYDSQRLYSNILRTAEDIYVAWPYLVDKKIFSFLLEGQTPNEAMVQILHPVFDIFTGLLYSTQVLVPIFFTAYLFWFKRVTMRQFGTAFLIMNLMGFITYYLVPAAPPWYVEIYGFAKPLPEMLGKMIIPGSIGRLVRFDDLFGIDIFKAMYSFNANYFGAIPSLHAAFPLLIFMVMRKRVKTAVNLFILLYVTSMAFSAVYLNHHYTIDIIWGWAYAIIAFYIMKGLKSRMNWLVELD